MALDLGNRGAIVRAARLGDHRLHLGEVIHFFEEKLRPGIAFQGGERLRALVAFADEIQRDVVRSDDPVLAAGLDRHVAQRHAFLDVQGKNPVAVELHRPIRGPIDADVADDGQDQVLGHKIARQLAVQNKTHRGRDLQPQAAGAHDEACIGVADTGSEFAERPGRTRMAIGAEENLAGPGVSFLGQSNVTDALVTGGADVVKVRQLLLGRKLPQDIDVAVGHQVLGEDVVIGDDDDLVCIPDPGILAKVLLEDADSRWSTDIMGHENVGIDPNIFVGTDAVPAGVASENFFSQGHGRHE